MTSLSEKYRDAALSNLSTNAQSISTSLQDVSSFFKELYSALSAVSNNKRNLLKISLDTMPDTDEGLILRSESISKTYKDVIDNIVTDARATKNQFEEFFKTKLNLLKQPSSQTFLNDALNKLKEKENTLKSYVNSFVSSTQIIKKLQSDVKRSSSTRSPTLIVYKEKYFVTLLKMEFIIFKVMSNEQLKNYWKMNIQK